MPQEVMTNDAIDGFVKMVEAAELMAKSLDIKTSVAFRSMLKSVQAMQMIESMNENKKLEDMKTGKMQ